MNDLGENLQEYLEYLQVEIKERMNNRNIMEESYAYPETTFTRIALDLLQEHDLTGEAVLVQYHSRIGSGVSFHSKCKVWEQRPDTVRQFKEPCQCGVPRIFQGAA